MKHEYRVQFNTYMLNPDPKAIQADCDQMGAAGWRMVSATVAKNMVLVFWEREVGS